MKPNCLFTLLVCFSFIQFSYCQHFKPELVNQSEWNISSPVAGGIYQRGSNNARMIKINGSFKGTGMLYSTTISATIKQLDLYGNDIGNPVLIPITTLSVNDGVRSFSGETYLSAGWYHLTITATGNDIPVVRNRTMKIGVGEVFIIAGQSNAQGMPNQYLNDNVANNPAPFLDAVRIQPDQFDAAKYLVSTDPTSVAVTTNFNVKKPYLSPLIAGREAYNNQNSGIAPLGNSLWYWISLGEKIAQTYNVPVSFFNAAYGGTTIKSWQESTDPNAKPLGRPGAPGDGRYPPGAPYGFLKNALKFYGSTYGVRSVLWLQGETDAEALRGGSEWNFQKISSADDYAQKLIQVINQSRQDLKPNSDLTWMVGKTSTLGGVKYTDGNQSAQSAIIVRQGQENVITSGWAKRGPDIDQILDRAPDGTHLAGAGIWKAADSWFSALQFSNLLSSNPVIPQSLGTEPRLVQLDDNGNVITVLPTGSRYIWYNGNGGNIDLNAPVGYGSTIPGNIIDPLVLIEDNQGNTTLGGLVFPNANAASTCVVNNPGATLDDATCNSVQGWALDWANLNQPVSIDIYVDGVKTYAGITADGDRPDLASYFNNPAARYHGFSYTFPTDASWRNGQNHSISVRICGTNNYIAGGPKTINCTGGSNPPNPPSSACSVSNPGATLDDVTCNSVRGWALDWSNLDQPVTIDIYVDGVKTYAGITANTDRPDLAAYFNNSSARYHGFSFTFPNDAAWKNGQNHSINVRICGTNNDMPGSPKTINCTGGSNPPNPPVTGGSLAFQIISYDCNSGVLQYRFTSSDNSPVNVSLPGIFGGTMSPNTVATYTFPGDGRQGRTVTGSASQSGNQISINFTNGCSLSGGRISYNSIDDFSENNDLKLTTYPNPNDGQFSISFSLPKGENYTIQVTDMLGHTLLKRESISKTSQVIEQVTLSNLNLKHVLVQVKSGLKTVTKMIIVQE
ncbi:sialate O-acetylesterase [Spirosoma validum]|uniref:T9SS type A sorting domain-containing protein n=1 Tax=Spirosoma validum TaxID=2771355 RepID=A0A927AXS0_9BACT|nr:sialate O-acetylesterase [Spirosoma validum]MBD2751760.1 T9SS type A sorting domain-containing protein [Spirosoma validum]